MMRKQYHGSKKILKTNPWLLAFYISKFLALLFLLLVFFSAKRLWRALFILTLAFTVTTAWNLYVFQKDDVRAVAQDFPETDFIRSLPASERIAIRNDPSVTIMNFYEEKRPFDWASNTPLFWNVATIEASALNLSPQIFSNFWSLETRNLYTPTELVVPHSKLYDLMGMNYLLSDVPLSEDAYIEALQGERYRIYQNLNAMPRFYFARTVEPVSSESVGSRIMDANWNPKQTTLVDGLMLPDGFESARSFDREESIVLLNEKRNFFDVKTISARPTFLATTHAFNKNWEILVDGAIMSPVKTNLYFLGVFLEPGEHIVQFQYQPKVFKFGFMINLSALFLLGLVLIVENLFSRRKKGSL